MEPLQPHGTPPGTIGKHGVRYGVSLRATDNSISMVTLAKRAEEMGFESVWLPKHTLPLKLEREIVDPEVYRHSVDQLIALAAAAGATSTIRLGTGVLLVPEHHPVRLAREIATLDFISGGRFQLGVGTGYVKEELEMFGVDIEHRWTQTREILEAMKALWAEGSAEYHGRYVNIPEMDMRPKPAQRPARPDLPRLTQSQRLRAHRAARRRLDPARVGHRRAVPQWPQGTRPPRDRGRA